MPLSPSIKVETETYRGPTGSALDPRKMKCSGLNSGPSKDIHTYVLTPEPVNYRYSSVRDLEMSLSGWALNPKSNDKHPQKRQEEGRDRGRRGGHGKMETEIGGMWP